jgi:hypothetical protein
VYSRIHQWPDMSEPVNALALRYDEIRSAQTGGKGRTLEMEKLVGAMRAILPSAELAHEEIEQCLRASNGGRRLLGLIAVETTPDARYFPWVAEVILKSLSAFEQYHALWVAHDLIPQLDHLARTTLMKVLHNPTVEERIGSDTSRAAIRLRMLETLKAA